MTQRDIVEVTQADREAAAAYMHLVKSTRWSVDGILSGGCDNTSIVQAFARHATTLRNRVAELETEADEHEREFDEKQEQCIAYYERITELETAIRTAVTYLDDLGLYAEQGHTLVPALQGLKDAVDG